LRERERERENLGRNQAQFSSGQINEHIMICCMIHAGSIKSQKKKKKKKDPKGQQAVFFFL